MNCQSNLTNKIYNGIATTSLNFPSRKFRTTKFAFKENLNQRDS